MNDETNTATLLLRIAETERERDDARSKASYLRDDNTRLEQERDEARRERDYFKSQYLAELNENDAALNKAGIKTEATNAYDGGKVVSQGIEELAADRDQARAELEESRQQVAKLRQFISETSSEVEKQLRAELEKAKGYAALCRAQFEKASAAADRINRELLDERQLRERAEKERDSWERGHEDMYAANAQCRKNLSAERQLRERAEKERDGLRQVAETADTNLSELGSELSALRAELAQAKEDANQICADLSSGMALAHGECAAERLAGNIVKEEFWKGELSAWQQIKSILDAARAASKEGE